ncbi:MAG: hypothetical protein KF774_15000 [Planctomyces sp.]|nr:hypothetical protein [Planctomyces sp.]
MFASRAALWLGLSLVLLAGLFREYDQEPLLFEPWHLLIPLAASTGLAALLYGTLAASNPLSNRPVPRLPAFRGFLSCVWMTAPLAAIYAIPVERLMSAPESVRWNLIFLGIVSVWRVLLMSQVGAILFRLSFVGSQFRVMLLADTVALALTLMMPIPLLQIMGGIQLTDSEQLINSVRTSVIAIGLLAWPIWFVGAAGSARRDSEDREAGDVMDSDPPVAGKVWLLPTAGTLIMLLACAITQPEQHRRRQVETLLRSERSAEAVELMSKLGREAFPPHWEPPPSVIDVRSPEVHFRHLQAALEDDAAAGWVRDVFAQKIVRVRGFGMFADRFITDLAPDQLAVLVDLLESEPKWLDIFDSERTPLQFAIDVHLESTGQYATTRAPADLLQRLLDVSRDHPEGTGFRNRTNRAGIQNQLNRLLAPAHPPDEPQADAGGPPASSTSDELPEPH